MGNCGTCFEIERARQEASEDDKNDADESCSDEDIVIEEIGSDIEDKEDDAILVEVNWMRKTKFCLWWSEQDMEDMQDHGIYSSLHDITHLELM